MNLEDWAQNTYSLQSEYLNDFSKDSSKFVFDNVLQDLARQENKLLAQIVAKTVEYPTDSINLEGKNFPILLILVKPLSIGLFSLAVILGISRFRRQIVVSNE